MLLIDLPMPEACDVCPFNYDFCWCKAFKDDEFDKYSDDWNDNVCERTTRPEYCPLEERKTGKWIAPEEEGCLVYDPKVYVQCSVCGKKSQHGRKDKFCRNCGALMKQE